jgi:hypothetical protein
MFETLPKRKCRCYKFSKHLAFLKPCTFAFCFYKIVKPLTGANLYDLPSPRINTRTSLSINFLNTFLILLPLDFFRDHKM